MKPRVFLSAVTSELGQTRQLAANVLTRLGYDPVWQDIFGTEPGDLRQMLRDKIDDCDGVVHLVGFAYGAEPPQPDPDFGRVSYTQFELLHAQQQKKKTWVLFAEEGFPSDRPLDQLDLPSDPAHRDPAAYQKERRTLQEQWRQRLRGEGHLRHAAATKMELELKLERLKDEFQGLRGAFRQWQRTVLLALLVLAALGVGSWWTLFRQTDAVQQVVQQGQQQIQQQIEDVQETAAEQSQRIAEELAALKPDDIKSQLRKTIEATYQRELAAAGELKDWQKRDAAKKDAGEARDKRLAEVDEFLASITSTIQAGNASPEFLELTRIIQEQGVDEALKYVTAQESRLFDEAESLTQQKRRKLAPLLEGIRLHRAQGDYVAARTTGEKLLKTDPQWPDALHEHFWTLTELGDRALRYETLSAATLLYQSAHTLALRLYDGTKTHPYAQRDLSVSYNKRGNVLLQTGQVQEALASYQQGLDIRLQLAQADPHDAQAQRDPMVSHYKLGETHVTLVQWDAAIAAFERAIAVLDGMIAQRMSVEASEKEKAVLESRIAFCREQKPQK